MEHQKPDLPLLPKTKQINKNPGNIHDVMVFKALDVREQTVVVER